jgi:hypothetical protein
MLAVLLLGVGVLGTPPVRSAPAEQLTLDEATVRQGSVQPDGPGLLEFFRSLTPGEKALEEIETLVKDLGSGSFRKRQKASEELIRIGPAARSFLTTAAGSKDLEVSRRAKDCLTAIEARGKPELIAAAVRLLAAKKPPGAARALLDYLPFADTEYLVEEINTQLPLAGFTGGKPDEALTKALEDRQPRRRAAAVEAFLRAGSADDQKAMRKFLKDGAAAVRIRVALALVERKDRDAVGVLIDAIPEASQQQFWQIEQILGALGGEEGPKVSPRANEVDRREFRGAWRKWWQDHGDKVDLAVLTGVERRVGSTLIVALDQLRAVRPGAGPAARVLTGRVSEIGRDGKVRWEITDLNYPIDAQVIGRDRVLVTEYRNKLVTERNFKGEVLWQKQADDFVLSAQRLPGGNTLLVLRGSVLEVNRAGEQVRLFPSQGGTITAARRLPNGDTVIIERTGLCLRLDRDGKELKRFQFNGAVSLIGTQYDFLPSGNVLVPLYTQNQVVEFNATGQQVWKMEVERPTAVSRLPNGNTLIGSRYTRKAIEVDKSGKKVWEYDSPNGAIVALHRR